MSEAWSTVYAGIGLIRTSVGTLGIAVLLFMLLRPLVMLFAVKLTLGYEFKCNGEVVLPFI